MTFPNSKVELHQWANSILLIIVGFFVEQTYSTVQQDHDKLYSHETRITVSEKRLDDLERGSQNKQTSKITPEADLPHNKFGVVTE